MKAFYDLLRTKNWVCYFNEKTGTITMDVTRNGISLLVDVQIKEICNMRTLYTRVMYPVLINGVLVNRVIKFIAKTNQYYSSGVAFCDDRVAYVTSTIPIDNVDIEDKFIVYHIFNVIKKGFLVAAGVNFILDSKFTTTKAIKAIEKCTKF